jgi:hypothetical protein
MCAKCERSDDDRGVFEGQFHLSSRLFINFLNTCYVTRLVLTAHAGHKRIATTQRYVTVSEDTKRRVVKFF